MSFRPAPRHIRKTPEEIERELEVVRREDPNAQVNPLKDNPNDYAYYQLVQNDKEVGWVYVKGTSGTNSMETWFLYKAGVSGSGAPLPGKTENSTRAEYTWPSGDATDVALRILYRGQSSSNTGPSSLSTMDYDKINVTVAL